MIFDTANNHYGLMYAGWHGPYCMHGGVLHIDMRREKICIQDDGTEDGSAEELVKGRVPRDRIVLVFKPPEIRSLYRFCCRPRQDMASQLYDSGPIS